MAFEGAYEKKLTKFRILYGVTGKSILVIFSDFHWNLKVDIWKFMFFKDRSGASRLMKTVVFGVVPRGPGDPRVKPSRALEGPRRARAQRCWGPRVLWGIKGVEETRSKDIFDLSRSGPKARRIYLFIYLFCFCIFRFLFVFLDIV